MKANSTKPIVAGETVGMLGLGIMGGAMSANLVKAGFTVAGYDPFPAMRAKLRKAGGHPQSRVADVAGRAAILIASLPSTQALAAVAGELATTAARGSVLIETSTLPLAEKEAARSVLASAGIEMLDCPLSGTGAQARTKDLSVYASGKAATIKRVAHVFPGFARTHYNVGKFGNGSKMKFVANLLVAIHNVSTAEALVLGQKGGLDPAMILKVVADGAGGSRMFSVRGPMMVAEDYSDATMKVAIWQKDMTIIGDFARELDCPTPLLSATAPIYNAAMAQGFATQDTAAVHAVLQAAAGVSKKSKARS